MTDTIKQLAEFLERQNIDYNAPDDSEEVLWFSLKLPNHEAAATFFVHYSNSTEVLVIMASRMVKFSSINHDILLRMNEFNADPAVFGCKMFIDPTGELTVGYSTFVRGDFPAPQIIDLVDIVLASSDKYYPVITSALSKKADE